jgi:hypothetical protein
MSKWKSYSFVIVAMFLVIGIGIIYFLLHQKNQNANEQIMLTTSRTNLLKQQLISLNHKSAGAGAPKITIPKGVDEESIFSNLQTASQKARMTIQSVTLGQGTISGYESVKATISGVGSQAECTSFLQELSQISRPVSIDSATLDGSNANMSFTCVVEFPYAKG